MKKNGVNRLNGQPPLLTDQVYDQLLSKILDSQLQPGDRLPPSVDLAKELGTSRAPVQKALNRLVQDSVVLQKKHIGFFIRSKEVQHGLTRGSIAIIDAGLAEERFDKSADIAPTFGIWGYQNIIEAARNVGLSVDIFHLKGMTEPISLSPSLKGIISFVPAQMLAKSGLSLDTPVVYLGVEDSESSPAVIGDIAHGVGLLTNQFIAQGHSKIAICGPNYWNPLMFTQAYSGYEKALGKAGLKPFVKAGSISQLTSSDLTEIKDFLDAVRKDGASAVISLDVGLASEICKLAKLLSIQVPENIGIASTLTGQAIKGEGKQLTGLNYNWQEVIDTCFDLLLNNSPKSNLSKSVFKPTLVKGDTVIKKSEMTETKS